MTSLGARVVIAGVASGVGKTTVATGVMAAMRRRGLAVANAKVGPDYIDPGYHSVATGRPPRNLDAWICGIDAIPPLAGRAAHGADVLMIEGVMGLYDGADDGTPSSTADVAVALDAPVILVVDVAAVGSSVAAVVRGFRDHDARVRIGGIVCNRAGSPRHEALLRDALDPLGVPVLGFLPRSDAFEWRDRHLGLVPVTEHPEAVIESLDRLAHTIENHLSLDTIEAIARSAPTVDVASPALPEPVGRTRIAVATGAAFGFTYADNLEAMEAGGAEIVAFDPLRDEHLPDAVHGIIVGGGFPETAVDELAANTALLAQVRARVEGGLPTWAECGGMLWLSEELEGRTMVGAVATTASMGDRLHIGYRHASLTVDSVLGPSGSTVRGHEFHYSICEPPGTAVRVSSPHTSGHHGFATPTLLASYVHHHAGGDPAPTASFLTAAARFAEAEVGHR